MSALISRLFQRFSTRARHKRARLFHDTFGLGEGTRILDLGSESGGNIHAVLARGRERFGFVPVLVGQSGKLPFPDGLFDIVYCSSVIEHVTVPKEEVWAVRSGSEFRERSLAHQRDFAREIQRVGRQFFVQTPYRWFLVENHSWLPFISWLPRRLQLPILKAAAKFWPKSTNPDWYLLDRRELKSMCEDAEIRDEKWLGLTKSIMAVKREQAR